MAYCNNVVLMGNLTRDPELRYTGTSKPVTDFGLAVNKQSKDKDREDQPLFIDVTVWGKTAEAVSQYLKKGSLALVIGELELDRWEKDGQKRSKIRITAFNVQFMDRKPSNNSDSKSSKPADSQPAAALENDDIPF